MGNLVVNEKEQEQIKEAGELLQKVVDILEYQDKPSMANQGQCLDGFSAFASYNNIAEKIREFLKGVG